MFCPDCGSYVNDLSKICVRCGCNFEFKSAKKRLKKVSLILGLNEQKIDVRKKSLNQSKNKSKSNKQKNKAKSKQNKSNAKKQKANAKKRRKYRQSLLYGEQNKKSKAKNKNKNSKPKKNNSKSKNKQKKNKNKKARKNKRQKLKMPKKVKKTSGRIEYNNGYPTREGMSYSGKRMKKGSFKKKRNGEHGGFSFKTPALGGRTYDV